MEPIVENRFELLVQSVVDYAIYMLDPDGIVTSWNPGARRIKGFTAEEIIGRHFSTFYTEEDRAAGRPQVGLETARREGRFEAEAWRVRKDGTRFWASVVIDAIHNPAGELVGFAKITRDMTDKREAQLALLDAERRFRLLVEGVTDYAIYMLDPNGQVTNWNAGASRIKGYSADEIVGQNFSRFYVPEDAADGVPARALETARREGRYEAEGWRQRKDGTRFWASVVIDAIRDEEGELIGFAKITRDVTERREAQKRIEESREQLFRSQKMEALGQLTGGLAHDFNNLLTAIMGAAELGLRSTGDAEKVAKMLEGIRASAQRGASLTRQLLAFARAQPLQLETLELTDFLPGSIALLRPSVREDIELVTEISDQVAPIEADPAQLELAILNLVFNARDAMPNGGTIRISASNVELAGKPEGLEGAFVAIGVADSGTGIAAEALDRVFEPFFTTKGFGEGTGLGLSQVFGFARQLGGAVTVESELGKGARFTLYVPVSRTAARTGVPGDEGASAALGRVLIVEDDEMVAELAAALLADMGFEATVVHSAREALEELAGRERPRLIFSDIVMPGGISGLELARQIRSRFPELPILLTTGYSEQSGGAHGFPVLPKPYEYDTLAKALTTLLEGQAQGRS
jgi:PAS domain S-box-containing protein